MTLYDEFDEAVWINEQHITYIGKSSRAGFVYISFVSGHFLTLSPFQPQERNDEAFMQVLTYRTTLNEVLLALENLRFG